MKAHLWLVALICAMILLPLGANCLINSGIVHSFGGVLLTVLVIVSITTSLLVKSFDF